MKIYNPKKFIRLVGKKFVAQHWESELCNSFTNAWRYTDWMVKKLRESNDPNAQQKIAYLLDLCWEKYPLF